MSVTTWQHELQTAVRDPTQLCQRLNLPDSYRAAAVAGAAEFPVFAPESFLRRVKPGDMHDPLLRQVLPLADEMTVSQGFSSDPVGDVSFKRQPGLLQKYPGRVLLMTTGLCAVHCRYCFRRHYPYDQEPQSLQQWQPAVDQIAADKEISEVILSGGDPLTLNDRKLGWLAAQFAEMRHIKRLRIHSRLPVMIPSRVDEHILEWMGGSRLQVVFVMHANHAQELDDSVWQSVERLQSAGVLVLNQSVLLRGINDSLNALLQLCSELIDRGVLPYYLHQLDRVQGAAHFEVPVVRGRELVSKLREQLPGYAVPRYVQEIYGESSKTVLL